MNPELAARFDQAVREDGRYAPEAYEFLHRGLQLATRLKYGERVEGRQHVTGQELCLALRLLAQQLWGPLAGEVLRHWGIRCTRDFGEMVYLMIDLGMMGKQDSDSIHDFDDVYSFAEAFGQYQIALEPGAERDTTD